jgi:geranylgeranyl diphosphate synthase, type II
MDTGYAGFEQLLQGAIERAAGPDCPPLLARALHHAVFPGGARVRPQLCVAVAAANGGNDPELAAAAGAAIELMHCASLVHDDLPCFDNAGERRGKQSVHRAYGEQIAVLAGDALIVSAFEVLGRAASPQPERLPQVLALIARGCGAPYGIAAGQAWESEPSVELSLYHQAKTGALFIAAACAGAAAAGVEVAPWRELGRCIGASYQVADDILDATSDALTMGKPAGRDEALGRPSAVRELGLEGAVCRLRELVEESVAAVPDCRGRERLQGLVREQSKRFFPRGAGRQVAA